MNLTKKDITMIKDALEMYHSFKIYGDGREAFQKQVDKLIKKVNLAEFSIN